MPRCDGGAELALEEVPAESSNPAPPLLKLELLFGSLGGGGGGGGGGLEGGRGSTEIRSYCTCPCTSRIPLMLRIARCMLLMTASVRRVESNTLKEGA